MRSLTPLVLENVTLPDFIQYVISHHGGPSTVVICSTKDTFLNSLVIAQSDNSAPEQHSNHETEDTNTTIDHAMETSPELPVPIYQAWSSMTLRELCASRDIRTVFCPDTTHLRAFLATYPLREPTTSSITESTQAERNGSCMLAILNPIHIHRHTSAFSAQGLNRTLAIAVEAAHLTGKQLVFAECPHVAGQPESVLMSDDTDTGVQRVLPEHPWEEEVSILNVTTKSFGTGERGWVGRTVKLRAIAERWCTFATVDALDHRV